MKTVLLFIVLASEVEVAAVVVVVEATEQIVVDIKERSHDNDDRDIQISTTFFKRLSLFLTIEY